MTQKQAIQLFEDRKVRTVWDERTETWCFRKSSAKKNISMDLKGSMQI